MVFIVLLIYVRTIKYGYLLFDDTVLVRDRINFLKNIKNIFLVFKENVFYLNSIYSSYYRPILNISLILDAQIWKDNIVGYRITNILIHIINVILLYKLLCMMNIKKIISYLMSLFFAINPLFVQAVVWIPGRNDLLLATFFLSSYIYLIYYLQKGTIKNLIFFLFFYLCLLFTKESGIFNIVIFLWHAIYNRRKKIHIRKNILLTLLLLVPIGVYIYFRLKVVNIEIFSFTKVMNMLWDNSIKGYLVYLGKMVLPIKLSVFPLLMNSNPITGIISLVIIIFYIIFSKEKYIRNLIAGILIFLLYFLPTFINSSSPDPIYLFEHRSYVPMIGLLLVIGGVSTTHELIRKKYSIILIIIFITLLIFKNINHQLYYEKPTSFWEEAYRESPQSNLTNINLAVAYGADGQKEKQIQFMEEVLLKKPDIKIIRNNLAIEYMKEGNVDRAKKLLIEEIIKNSLEWRAYINLGYIYYLEKNYELAEELWKSAIDIYPDSIDARMQLIELYMKQGRTDEAMNYYKEVNSKGVNY